MYLQHGCVCLGIASRVGTDALQTYSFSGAEEGQLRFTTTPDTFCIIALSRPEADEVELVNNSDAQQHPRMAVLSVQRPVPILPQDHIFLLGGSGRPLSWKVVRGGLKVFVPEDELDRIEHAWAFEIRYGD